MFGFLKKAEEKIEAWRFNRGMSSIGYYIGLEWNEKESMFESDNGAVSWSVIGEHQSLEEKTNKMLSLNNNEIRCLEKDVSLLMEYLGVEVITTGTRYLKEVDKRKK